MYSTIQIENIDNVATLWLNRPDVKNAFNRTMVEELTQAFIRLGDDISVKIIVIRGRGDIFCSGADLNWMRKVSEMNYERNYTESLALANCFYELHSVSKPVITLAHGAVKGGGNGLVAAADIAICTKSTVFAFSEVRLGVIPAVISPYVVNRIGKARAMELMLTAKSFSGSDAAAYNLVNTAVEENELSDLLANYINLLLTNSSLAMQNTKELLQKLPDLNKKEELVQLTAKIIAQARISKDGQEGMAAFLEKRKPNFK